MIRGLRFSKGGSMPGENKAAATRKVVIEASRITEQALKATKSRPLTVAQRAKFLKVKPELMRTPWDLTPARLINGDRYIQLFSSMMEIGRASCRERMT